MTRLFGADEIVVRWVNKEYVVDTYGKGKFEHCLYVFGDPSQPMSSNHAESSETYKKLMPVLDLMEPQSRRVSTNTKDYYMTREEYVAITGEEP